MFQAHNLKTIGSALFRGYNRIPAVISTSTRPLATQLYEKLKLSNDISPEAENVLVRMTPHSNMKVETTWLRKHCPCGICNNKHPSDSSSQTISAMNEAGEGDWFEVVWRDGHVSWFNKDWLRENYKS